MGFWSSPDKFSIKDALGILFGLLFTGIAIFAIIADDPTHVATALDIIKTLSPILITLVGGYAVTEGARGVMNTYYDRSNAACGDDEMKPPISGGQI